MRGLVWAACVAVVTGCAALAGCESERSPQPDLDADVQLKILDYAGVQRLIADARDKVVIVDVWSTGCPPCIAEFPRLVALDRKYASRGVKCISLSLDFEGVGKPEDVAPQVLKFLRKQGATLENVLAADEPEVIYKKLEAASIPLVLVYDRQGKLRGRFEEPAVNRKGAAPKSLYDQVEAMVDTLLAEH
jgi:thiol-disulfide isomerase/thioredoxin